MFNEVYILIIIALVVALAAMFFKYADILKELDYAETTKATVAEHLNNEILRLAKRLKESDESQWCHADELTPRAEKEVIVLCEDPSVMADNKLGRYTCRAVYEDGSVPVSKSMFSWDDWELDEDLSPVGWFAFNREIEEISYIDNRVIAWRPVPLPPETL